MATYNYVDITLPEAHSLSDLIGISTDLTRASEMASFVLRQVSAKEPQWHLLEAYSIATAVTYSRSFISGVRRWLKGGDLDILDSSERTAHDRILGYRNKHFAHSVNTFEENLPRARYCVERVENEGFQSIDYSTSRVSGMSHAELKGVVSLCEKFENYVHNTLMPPEEDRLLKLVRSLPVQEVLAWGKQPPFAGGHGDILLARRQKPKS